MSQHGGWTGVLAAIRVALGGCATVGDGTLGTDELLSAAGFQMKLADTPERLTTLRTLPARTLVPQPRDGQMDYVYADPGACGSLYVGMEAQYQQYQRFALQQERLRAAREYWSAMATWGAWGPWSWF